MSLPIRARLTAWYVALLAVILAGSGAFLLTRLRNDLVGGVDRSLESRAAQISLGYQGTGEGEFQDVSNAAQVRLDRGESAAQLLSADGHVLETSGDAVAANPMIAGAALAQALAGGRVVTTSLLGPDREPFRVLAVSAPSKAQPGVLVVVDALEQVNSSVRHLLVLLLILGPVALAAAALGGWWLAHKALQPVARITERAAEIGVDRLSERVPIPSSSDELFRLAGTLNAMLDRIETGVQEKRRFVADASHELRTPLAIMRSELEVSLRSGGLPPQAREVLESMAEEVDRMSRIVLNLLTLARIDEGKLELLRAPVDLREVAESVAANLQALAQARGIGIEIEGEGGPVMADRERIDLAVGNVVENALKYTSTNGTVRLSVWANEGEVGLKVTDRGPGIPPDALPQIFDRFFRVDASRSRALGGSGLGLAISREIAEAHGGRVWVRSELGKGSEFCVALPASEPRIELSAPHSHV